MGSDTLEMKVDDLLDMCRQLSRENERLRKIEKVLKEERVRIIEKHNFARLKLESVVERLHGLEQES